MNRIQWSDVYKAIALPILFLLSGCTGMQPAQAPEIKLEEAHLFGVTRVAFDISGERVISGGFKGDIALWALPEGLLISRIKVHQDYVIGLAWITDRIVATASEDGHLAVIDTVEGRVIWQERFSSGVSALTYRGETKEIITGHFNGEINAFRFPELTLSRSTKMSSGVVSLKADRQGEQLAVALDDNHMALLDFNLKVTLQLQSPDKNALELSFSHDGHELAAGAWYNVYYWNLKTGQLRVQETEHWGAVTSVDYTPDSKQVITLGRHTDANLRLVDVATGVVQRRLQGHRLCGASVRVSPNGRYVVSGSDDETIRLYDLRKTYQPVRPLEGW